ncbi:hypothetical protein [Pedobacter sp. SYSU D00535]|uniref:hypothetical protein n=1 Tax=Pedobacter sp. SYSU D00535 TaxID=2810308 RepID=UPI001A9574D0|nr:hypothetical protein [Pedobacter sp. SYSU D00535]
MKRRKTWLTLCSFLLLSIATFSQTPIRDIHITHQQERMVYYQWDRSKFSPKKGFLGLNPNYWLTWGLHPDYPKSDKRPLGPSGPQTLRLGLVLALENSSNKYLTESDTLANVAVSEALNYSPFAAAADPLWLLYYQKEFRVLEEKADPLQGLAEKEKTYLISSGLLKWYMDEREAIRERLKIARNTILDRGSRTLACQRILMDMEVLEATWSSKRQRVTYYLRLKEKRDTLRKKAIPVRKEGRSDKDIAESILLNSKL